MDKVDILIAEWKEIRESLRYFGNKRFAQLTVFIAVSGFMVNAHFNQTGLLLHALRIVGIVLSILFFIMERRSVEYIDEFVKRGEEIEKEITIVKLIHCRPKKTGINKLLTGTFATYAVYLLVAMFWVISFVLK
jgi:hypothetical protein